MTVCYSEKVVLLCNGADIFPAGYLLLAPQHLVTGEASFLMLQIKYCEYKMIQFNSTPIVMVRIWWEFSFFLFWMQSWTTSGPSWCRQWRKPTRNIPSPAGLTGSWSWKDRYSSRPTWASCPSSTTRPSWATPWLVARSATEVHRKLQLNYKLHIFAKICCRQKKKTLLLRLKWLAYFRWPSHAFPAVLERLKIRQTQTLRKICKLHK